MPLPPGNAWKALKATWATKPGGPENKILQDRQKDSFRDERSSAGSMKTLIKCCDKSQTLSLEVTKRSFNNWKADVPACPTLGLSPPHAGGSVVSGRIPLVRGRGCRSVGLP